METPVTGLRAHLRRAPVALAGCGLALVLAACGGSDEPETAEDPASSAGGTTSGMPACADVWVDGQELPQRYAGCTEDGAEVRIEKTRCSSGQVLVTYDDRFYAVLGGPVNETDALADDKDYRQAELSCLA